MTATHSHLLPSIRPGTRTRSAPLWLRLYVAASQASYIGDVGSAISAASANCSMANSKKVACPDINTLCLLTHFDVYVGGLTNVERSFMNTPYTGTYGPRIDTGCTPPGLLANYYRSDHRGHGSRGRGGMHRSRRGFRAQIEEAVEDQPRREKMKNRICFSKCPKNAPGSRCQMDESRNNDPRSGFVRIWDQTRI